MAESEPPPVYETARIQEMQVSCCEEDGSVELSFAVLIILSSSPSSVVLVEEGCVSPAADGKEEALELSASEASIPDSAAARPDTTTLMLLARQSEPARVATCFTFFFFRARHRSTTHALPTTMAMLMLKIVTYYEQRKGRFGVILCFL